MPRKRVAPAEVTAISMQDEIEALRVEMGRLRKRETDLAARIAERAKSEERAFERLLGQVLLHDLDPVPPLSHQSALDDASRQALGHRSDYYAVRIRDVVAAMPACPPLVTALLQRLDQQSGRGASGAPRRLDSTVVERRSGLSCHTIKSE